MNLFLKTGRIRQSFLQHPAFPTNLKFHIQEGAYSFILFIIFCLHTLFQHLNIVRWIGGHVLKQEDVEKMMKFLIAMLVSNIASQWWRHLILFLFVQIVEVYTDSTTSKWDISVDKRYYWKCNHSRRCWITNGYKGFNRFITLSVLYTQSTSIHAWYQIN